MPLCEEHHDYAHKHTEEAMEKIPIGAKEVLDFYSGEKPKVNGREEQ